MNRQWLTDWRSRHRSRLSVALHAIGIPLTIAALVLIFVQLIDWRWDLWWRPLVLAVGGYFLQFLGHLYEGNTMGELIVIRRALGLPYTAVSPRYAHRDPAHRSDEGDDDADGDGHARRRSPSRARRSATILSG